MVDDRYVIEVVARSRIDEIDIATSDGAILEIDLEEDSNHHDCPHWGC